VKLPHVVLPLLQLLGEEVGVVDDLAFAESVEFLRVDAVGSLHFAVQPGCPRFDLDVVDAFVEQVPVERGAEFGIVVGLHPLDGERQLGQNVIDELDSGLLVAAWVGGLYASTRSSAMDSARSRCSAAYRIAVP